MNNSTPQKCRLILEALLVVTAITANAQKLPSVQKTSVYAPINVKTDGKTNEWENKFEAQNNATGLYYTMANDGDKLYLTIQGRPGTGSPISKMQNGGITLTFKSNDKSVKPVVFDFLIFERNGLTDVGKKMNAADAKMDSLLGPINTQVSNALKEIGVKGVNDITDTLISVYNEYGIKQAVQYDSKKALTCEIAIPLKYISHLMKDGAFKYNVKLNAMKMGKVSIVMNGSPVAPGSAGEAKAAVMFSSISISGTGGMGDVFNDTDFSGAYILAKK
ncbi:hypothetical protein HQ865_05200 [Mucilaginibacter mali]|uniref:Uncharacterized protein n=1 Tax=Mucilaginibacter mali TaxID=2740462 RepID=A0A7D4QDT6_9SPHI|nr:hypothetical protein [Mucilaginibacter mali]QKJ29172.1 hypothetical protein HQ865_05200 [Mucilaginibacter mali]